MRYGKLSKKAEHAMKKIVFLDVDGVLNNQAWAYEMYKHGVLVYRDCLLYEPSLLQLKRIVDGTGAIIVVSSSWRQDAAMYEKLRDWLERFGMEIYDRTPYVCADRGDDITAWFILHPGKYRYVILDDDYDMGVHIDHLVQTEFDAGLTEADADRCIKALGRKKTRGQEC